jgi:hypothetical protein
MSPLSHRRSGIVGVIAGIAAMLLVVGPVAAALLPVASLSPKTGLAGSEIIVTVSAYSPGIPIEVRETNGSGALIATGATDAAGAGSFPVTIPASASGSYLLYICGLCASEYPEWATRSFLVTGPAAPTTTTTVTTVATTTTAAATTTLAPGTTVAAVTTSPASVAPGADSTTAAPESETSSSSRGLLIGAIAALAVMLAVIVGILIGGRGTTSATVEPPPPPPPAP